MSEVSINILFHHSDSDILKQAANMIGETGQENDELGYVVESHTGIDSVILAQLLGGSTIETATLYSRLRKLKPDCLGFEVFHDSGEESEVVFLKNGRKVKKNTVLNALREQNLEFALYHALQKRDKKTINKLLQKKEVKVDAVIGGVPLIFLIIDSDDVDAFKLFLARGVNINLALGSDLDIEDRNEELVWLNKGTTLLIAAIEFNSPKITQYLIEHAGNINAVDRKGNSALILLASYVQMHRLLETAIKAGADLNQEDEQGYTPLFSVICADAKSQKYTIDLCNKLISMGADLHHTSKNGMNARWAVHLANRMEEKRKITDFVESQGITSCHAPSNFYDKGSIVSKLDRAVYYKDPESFERLLDENNLTPYEIADVTRFWGRQFQHYGNYDTYIRILFSKGAPGFVLRDRNIIESWTKNEELRKFLLQKLDQSKSEKNAYIESYRDLAVTFIRYLSNYTIESKLPDYLDPEFRSLPEDFLRENLERDAAKVRIIRWDTLTGDVNAGMSVLYFVRLPQTSEKLYVKIDPRKNNIASYKLGYHVRM